MALVRLALAPTLTNAFDVEAERVLGPRRGCAAVVRARHSAMYLAVFEARLTLTETAALFSRDRRGVAYAVSRLEAKRDAAPHFDAIMDHLAAQFQQRLDEVRARHALPVVVGGGTS